MDVHLLGPVEVLVEGKSLGLGGTKQRALLAMLALEAGRTVSADRLDRRDCGATRPPPARRRWCSSTSRSCAGCWPERTPRSKPTDAATSCAARGRVDVAALRGPADRPAAPPARRSRLARPRSPTWRASLSRRPISAVWKSSGCAPAKSAIDVRARRRPSPTSWAGETRRAGRAAPLPESPARATDARALPLRSARRRALEAYRHARELLVGETGVEPGPELRSLHEAILQQDPSLVAIGCPGERRALHAPAAPAATRVSQRRRALVTGPGARGSWGASPLLVGRARRGRRPEAGIDAGYGGA